MTFKDQIVLIVGASSGLGRDIAKAIAAEGGVVVVTARRADKLDAVAAEITRDGGTCMAIAADAQDAAAAAAVVEQVVTRYGRIDMVLLNAGGAPALDIRTMSAVAVNACMRANYDVAVNYLLPILHQMVRQKSGLVAHTNSLAGFLGVPLQGPYSAAKGALRLLIDTCRIEFGRYDIRFVSIYPGFVATDRILNNGMPSTREISQAQGVAHMLYALRHEPTDYLFPFSMRWLIRLLWCLPKGLTTRILRARMPVLSELEDLPKYA